MQLNLLALAVIPELRISDLSLVDVSRFVHIPVRLLRVDDRRGSRTSTLTVAPEVECRRTHFA